jgi:hypothetical protein
MAVDKIDEYAKKMKEKSEKYKEDLKTIKDIRDEDIKYLHNQFTLLIRLKSEEGCNCTAVIGVRGTKFSNEIKEDKSIETTVLEGIVYVAIPELNKKISLIDGNRVVIAEDGTIKQEKVKNSERWWER